MRLVGVALQPDRPPSGYESRNNSMNSVILYTIYNVTGFADRETVLPTRKTDMAILRSQLREIIILKNIVFIYYFNIE